MINHYHFTGVLPISRVSYQFFVQHTGVIERFRLPRKSFFLFFFLTENLAAIPHKNVNSICIRSNGIPRNAVFSSSLLLYRVWGIFEQRVLWSIKKYFRTKDISTRLSPAYHRTVQYGMSA